jgi:predicted transposase YbfD/YdcC
MLGGGGMAYTLWDVLGSIADRRGRKGRQFPLQVILAIAIAAMLAGANDLRAIFRWGRRLKPEALALFGIGRAPCHATYHYVFQSLDGDALAKALGGFACAGGAPGHIAIDGKTLKGTRRLDAKALHVLSAFATGLSAVIGDIVVKPGQNEITAALGFLKDLPLEGAIITGDAMFCQRELCQAVKDRKGDYLFVAKDNQPQLKASIAESFGDLSPCGACRPAARSEDGAIG